MACTGCQSSAKKGQTDASHHSTDPGQRSKGGSSVAPSALEPRSDSASLGLSETQDADRHHPDQVVTDNPTDQSGRRHAGPPLCWSWTTEDVSSWLERAGHREYARIFKILDIDGRKLCTITPDELRKYGFGKKWRLCREVAHIVSSVNGRKPWLDPNDYKLLFYPYTRDDYLTEEDFTKPFDPCL